MKNIATHMMVVCASLAWTSPLFSASIKQNGATHPPDNSSQQESKSLIGRIFQLKRKKIGREKATEESGTVGNGMPTVSGTGNAQQADSTAAYFLDLVGQKSSARFCGAAVGEQFGVDEMGIFSFPKIYDAGTESGIEAWAGSANPPIGNGLNLAEEMEEPNRCLVFATTSGSSDHAAIKVSGTLDVGKVDGHPWVEVETVGAYQGQGPTFTARSRIITTAPGYTGEDGIHTLLRVYQTPPIANEQQPDPETPAQLLPVKGDEPTAPPKALKLPAGKQFSLDMPPAAGQPHEFFGGVGRTAEAAMSQLEAELIFEQVEGKRLPRPGVDLSLKDSDRVWIEIRAEPDESGETEARIDIDVAETAKVANWLLKAGVGVIKRIGKPKGDR